MDPQLTLLAGFFLWLAVGSVGLVLFYLVLRFAIRDGVSAALQRNRQH